MTAKSELFEAIKVDMATGKVAYPSPEGFTLDLEAVYRVAALHAPFCKTMEQALRHAIHGQICAYEGAKSLFRGRK